MTTSRSRAVVVTVSDRSSRGERPDTGGPLLAGMSRATALAVVPEGVEHVGDGDVVEVLVLERRGR